MAIDAHSTTAPRKRSRSYSIKEAEWIARKLPLQRSFSPIEAAHAVAQYLDPDPAFWLEQAGLAGMAVGTDGQRVYTLYPEGTTPQTDFLEMWLSIGGGRKALRALLAKREAAHG